jgi:hypothetical protein
MIESYLLKQLAWHSNLLSFASDITQKNLTSRLNGRANVPFFDPGSQVTYYLMCKTKERERWELLF